MAGSGSRLGLPFPKPLAPTFTHAGMRPLYWHAQQRLYKGTNEVMAIVAAEDSHYFENDTYLSGIIYKLMRGTATDSVAYAARQALTGLDDVYDTLLVALPDSIWYPDYAFKTALLHHVAQGKDITLLTMRAEASMLDHVSDAHGIWVEPHEGPESTKVWNGWFAFIGKSEVLARWDADLSWADNLNKSENSITQIGYTGSYYDLGTPERYEKYIAIDKTMKGS